MRWVSSKESVAKGEVSVLAIVETMCAIALVFYLSSHFNTLRWLAHRHVRLAAAAAKNGRINEVGTSLVLALGSSD
jgi:hypothetical protein